MALQLTDDLVSVEDYLAGELVSEVKHEYLGGIVHAMAGAKMGHNRAVTNATASLHGSLKGKPCQPYNSDTKVRIQLPNQIRFYYPDLQVICEPVDEEASFTDSPVVVVEVFSQSTRRIDAGEKRDAYLTIPSLKVLILVDPTKVSVNVDRRHPNGGFMQENYRNLADTVDLPEIEAQLPLADIYQGLSAD
ncbi:MAG: Uma2 family endonuclease [Akkermansiaceae bacterium]|nr:Uma2 family endonuclease [Akkermansiaceae bacterium]